MDHYRWRSKRCRLSGMFRGREYGVSVRSIRVHDVGLNVERITLGLTFFGTTFRDEFMNMNKQIL